MFKHKHTLHVWYFLFMHHICDISRRVRLDSLKREQDGGGGGQYSADLTQRALLFFFMKAKKNVEQAGLCRATVHMNKSIKRNRSKYLRRHNP